MNLRRHFPTFERIFHWWNVRFTPGGKAISLLAVYAVPAILSFDDAMPFVGLSAFSVLLLTSLFARIFRPSVASKVRTPDFATVGQQFVTAVDVENTGAQAALDLIVRFHDRDPDWVVNQELITFSLEPNESHSHRVGITPTKRGLEKIPRGAIHTTFPLNLLRRLVAPVEGSEIAVLPRALPLAIGANDGVAELLGIEQRLLATAGQGFDYIGSREYREGPVRRWDYSSWARLGQPVVREFAEEADRQVAVLIDTRMHQNFIASARSKATFEDFICCAFSVVEHLLKEDIEIAVCVVGDTVSNDIARAGNFGHRKIRKLIATAERTRLKDEASQLRPLTQHTDGPILVLVPAWDASREELVSELSRSHSYVRPVVFQADENETAAAGTIPVWITNRGIQLG